MTNKYDVIIAGSGLAGLIAGLYCQKANYKTLIIEKLPRAGGLCGTHVLDNYEFIIACNDFGSSVEHHMETTGVDVKFHSSKIRFYIDEKFFDMPPSFASAAKLAPLFPDVFRLFKFLKGEKNNESSIDELSKNLKSNDLIQLLNSLAFPLGMSPDDFLVKYLKANFSKKFNYGWDKTVAPLGGPQVMVDKMLERFQELGGEIIVSTEVTKCESFATGLKEISTPGKKYLAKEFISSSVPKEHLPSESFQGLHAHSFHLAIDNNFLFPKGIKSISFFPRDLGKMLKELSHGAEAKELGFHLVQNELTSQSDYNSINVYFLAPRGKNSLLKEERSYLDKMILSKIEEKFPGFTKSIIYKKLISAEEFEQIHGISSCLNPSILPAEIDEAKAISADKSVHYLGSEVYPPGSHSCGAMLSGAYAFKSINSRLNPSREPSSF